MEYLPWKRSLKIETEYLQLTAAQWLQLLDARTEGEPNAILKRLRIVQIESDPEHALDRAWESLDERYRTEHNPSQRLLKDLTQGEALAQSKTQSLFAFSQNCESVLHLRQRNPRFLPELNEKTTLDALIQRLDPYLLNKWQDHRVSNLEDLDTPSFIHFAQWIKKRAAISRNMQDTRPSQSHLNFRTDNQKEKPSKAASTSSNQKPRVGSKEYRDAVKRNRSPSPTPINNSNKTPNNSLFPKHVPSSSNLRDKISNTQCAWCVANDLIHNHTTDKCNLIKHANDMDQYKAIYKYRICSSCLSPSHYWRNCPNVVPVCESCNFPHHPNIACRPERDISPLPISQ